MGGREAEGPGEGKARGVTVVAPVWRTVGLGLAGARLAGDQDGLSLVGVLQLVEGGLSDLEGVRRRLLLAGVVDQRLDRFGRAAGDWAVRVQGDADGPNGREDVVGGVATAERVEHRSIVYVSQLGQIFDGRARGLEVDRQLAKSLRLENNLSTVIALHGDLVAIALDKGGLAPGVVFFDREPNLLSLLRDARALHLLHHLADVGGHLVMCTPSRLPSYLLRLTDFRSDVTVSMKTRNCQI